MLHDAVASSKFFMTTFRKKIIMGASASNDRRNPMTRATPGDTYTPTAPPAPPSPQNRDVSIKVTNAPSRIMRDEIFDVTITVSSPPGAPVYTGTMELTLSQGKKYQTLGNRRDVQMFHFTGGTETVNSDGEPITLITFERNDLGVKTFQAVINIAQKVRITATDQRYRDLCNVTPEIEIVHRLRQYTTHGGNANVNNYDNNIIDQLNYWDDWHISAPPDPSKQTSQNQAIPYTFMTDARPSAELIKALAYKASGLNPGTPANPNLMRMTANALNRMTTGHSNVEEDVNASVLPLETPDREVELNANGWITYLGTYSTDDGNAAPLMNYGTRNQDGTIEKAPAVTTIDDSFKWGIRWLISKRTHQLKSNGQVSRVRRINWWTHDGAVKAYADSNPQNSNRGSDQENAQNNNQDYVMHVRRLYGEGVNPNSDPNNPTYLWPIKADGSARQ